MAEVEETLKRIQAMKGVKGISIINGEGIPIKSTMDHDTTVHLAHNIQDVVDKASSVVKELDTGNELHIVRLHTRKDEIMCATDPQFNYKMIVVQEARRSDHGKCD